ncbi:MAG: TldD/PmbA family protein, partial [Candidatus Korarchaeota archaeon]|nr:TldD/PmbA family protein [Candidatus Korarchaeota archaeon]
GLEVVEGTGIAEEAAKRAVEALSAKPAPPGPHPAILDPKLAGVFIHEAFGHAAEGDAVVNNESILTGKLGEKVGSEVVSVVDDPTIEGLYGFYRYDDEGTESRRKYIVKEGILSGYMTNLETASKLGIEPTGNARSMDYSNPPIVRMSNTFIDRGDWTLEEMLSDMKRGIYAFGSLYGYTDPAKGQFMFKAEGGWLIENGELKQRLREVAITGMTLEVLNNMDAVGKDLSHDPGMCGKMGQWVPVTTGAPHVRVSRLVFGGR